MFGESSLETVEVELVGLLDQCELAYRDAFNRLSNVKAKIVAGLSPQAKASLEIMGSDALRDMAKCENLSLELQRRIIDVRARATHTALSKTPGEAQRDLKTLQSHALAVERGQAKLDAVNRRRLARALTIAELRVAERI